MLLIETQYFPSIAWCAAVWPEKMAALDAAENYQKGALRNRCHIAGPNGVQRLSIPLMKGKHQRTPVKEVRIAYDEPWQRQHWRSIQAAYGNAPFFEHYAADFLPFFERHWRFLYDFNFEIQQLVLKNKLGWAGELISKMEYCARGSWQNGRDLRGEISGGVGECPAWFSPRRYAQVFEERHGFLPNLSVLDLLFCGGKSVARDLLSTNFLQS